MSPREFKDEHGRRWEVWEVSPASVARELEAESNRPGADHPSSDRRRDPLARVTPALKGGWLAFQCDAESRRLSPIPIGWVTLSNDELAQLAKTATPVRGRIPPGFPSK